MWLWIFLVGQSAECCVRQAYEAGGVFVFEYGVFDQFRREQSKLQRYAGRRNIEFPIRYDYPSSFVSLMRKFK
ncbi:hypothetical protein DE146DRAFT_666111 [Phaeosphaeria sp. MPI-PUGE-AT-0046c]|nr:hypothetical protein DE146DRAFT_666111 [Phaeosphaeria sp. MPI-PUGE-AT-0046c]